MPGRFLGQRLDVVIGHDDVLDAGMPAGESDVLVDLCGKLTGGGIGVTGAVREELTDKERLVSRGRIAVAGVESPLTIYEPERE